MIGATTGKDLAISSADSKEGSFQTDAKSFNIEPTMLSLKNSAIKKAAAILYKNKIWFSLTKGNTAYSNNMILQYDFMRISNSDRNTGAWSLFDNHYVNNFAIFGDSLYGGSSLNNGFVYKLDNTHNDRELLVVQQDQRKAISSYFVTAGVSGIPEHRDHTKVWRWLYVWVECAGNWNMSVSYLLDYSMVWVALSSINVNGGGSLWGTAKYNVSLWGGGLGRKKVKVPLGGVESKDIQFKFSTNALDNYWKIHKIQVFYSVRGLR
jgi:hypothetical protein